MEDKKQLVKEAIVRAVPSVMDLVFGCEVKKAYRMFQNSTGYVCGVDRSDIYIRYGVPSVEEDTALFQRWDIKPEEIIGRPIQLADVLVAIAKKVKPFPDLELGSVQLDIAKHGTNGMDNGLWDLSQDFDHQSEATIDFLWSLFCE